MNSVFSSEQMKAEALRLGFSACGIAEARPVDEATATASRRWIASGGHADMHYLENNIDKRLDPTLLLPGARSIIVVAMNYAPASRLPEGEYQIADYALGQDYHDVMRSRLRRLSEDGKICVDTVPILERYWAWQAGLGFIGRNRQLIIPGAGSMFFLGEFVSTRAADHYDQPMPERCGTCHRCLDACPTGALQEFDAGRCLSYQTIENRGEIDEDVKDKLGTTIYGCDRCLRATPQFKESHPTAESAFQPTEALLQMSPDDWKQLTEEQYRTLFKGSAVKRAKYPGLKRNIAHWHTDDTDSLRTRTDDALFGRI